MVDIKCRTAGKRCPAHRESDSTPSMTRHSKRERKRYRKTQSPPCELGPLGKGFLPQVIKGQGKKQFRGAKYGLITASLFFGPCEGKILWIKGSNRKFREWKFPEVTSDLLAKRRYGNDSFSRLFIFTTTNIAFI